MSETGGYVVNMGELVEVLAGTDVAYSETTLRELIRRHGDQFPCLERGTNGKSYRFDAREVVTFLRRHKAEAERAQDRRAEELAQLRLELTGGSADEADDYKLSGRQRKDEIEAELAKDKLRRTRGELLPADEVERLLTDAFADLRAELLALPDNLAKTCALGADERARTDRLVRAMLGRCAERLQSLDGQEKSRDAA